MKEIEEELQKKLKDPEGSFTKMFTTPKLEMKYTMPFQYRKKNKDGEFQKKETVIYVAIAYNPWTGEKL